MYHIPVLPDECIEGLNIRPDGIYVDATFGSGQHAVKILQKLTSGKLVAFDRDPDAMQNLISDKRFLFIQQNYRYLVNFLKFNGIHQIDGLLADLGISSWQIDQPDRGFSIRLVGELDMRMDTTQGSNAREIVNASDEAELYRIFRQYGEIHNAGKLVLEILKTRQQHEITTTGQLKEAIIPCAPKGKENQYLAKAFQAIRIEVNDELDSLKDLLQQSAVIIKPGGRIAVISYHSLEDRLVKNFFRSGNFKGIIEKDFYGNPVKPLRIINRKAIVPGPGELEANPRSRSAKLRIAEKI